jgi:hypothetical protein
MSTSTENLHAEHHVKFNIQEEEFKNHHENLEITTLSANTFHVNLGYLKVEHNYRVTFSLRLSDSEAAQVKCGESLRFLADRSSKHVTFKECKRESTSDNVYTFTMLFFAYREKHDQETVYFRILYDLFQHLRLQPLTSFDWIR